MTTSNVKLLPLPGIRSRFHPMDWHAIEAFATNYALANVEANTEALRAEVDRLKQMLGDCYVEAGADTDGNEPSRMYAQALSAVQDLRRDYDETLAEPDYKARADRLAEALREKVRDWTNDIDPREGDRMMAGWNGALEKCAYEIEALLHKQEDPT